MLNYQIIGKRNPIVFLTDFSIKIQTIGDPHLGRIFKTGVKPSKIGIREDKVFLNFIELLNPSETLGINYVVILGDLFDKAIVTPTVLQRTYNIITKACLDNPLIQYRIVSGNHDLSKNTSIISSYKILANMLILTRLPNLQIVVDEPFYEKLPNNSSDNFYLYFDTYNPFHISKFRQDFILPDSKMVSFGHWDTFVDNKSWNPSNLLISSTSLFVSGHEHLPFHKVCFNTPYICTGSMQPYSHAEDDDSILYLTLDVNEINFDNLPDFSDKNLRLIVPKNYVLPKSIDCLSLTYKLKDVEPVTEKSEEVVEIQNVSDFNTQFLTTIVEKNLLNEKQLDQLLNIIVNKTYLNDN